VPKLWIKKEPKCQVKRLGSIDYGADDRTWTCTDTQILPIFIIFLLDLSIFWFFYQLVMIRCLWATKWLFVFSLLILTFIILS